MREILFRKLHDYIRENNPEKLFELQVSSKVDAYLETKVEAQKDRLDQLVAACAPAYIIEEICMNDLTAEYKPSRYNYLVRVLEENFSEEYEEWQGCGILTYEALNLLKACEGVFESMQFSEENEDDPMICYAVIGTIKLYLIETFVDSEYLDKIDFGL